MKLYNKILMLLKTPPPFGGGEIMHQYLLDYYSTNSNVIIQEITSTRRNKSNQGIFKVWKLFEYISIVTLFLKNNFKTKPKIIYFSIGKSFINLLKDSVFIIIPWLFGQKVIIELHGASFGFLRNAIQNKISKLILNRAYSIRVLSRSIENELNLLGIKNTFIIENGIAIEHREINLSNVLTILFVGTLSREKGFDNIIKSLIKLKIEHNISLRLNCIGEWKSKTFEDEIIKSIKANKIEQNIKFFGYKFGAEKWDIFANSDILILPSQSEGQPLVILEALGMGLIVIASNVGGISDTLANSENLLINTNSYIELTNAILKILSYDKQVIIQIKEKNKKIFKERYTLEKYLTITDEYLMGLLKK